MGAGPWGLPSRHRLSASLLPWAGDHVGRRPAPPAPFVSPCPPPQRLHSGAGHLALLRPRPLTNKHAWAVRV